MELRRGEKVAAVPCSWQEGQSPWIPPWLSNNPPSAACDGGGGGGGGGSSGALVGEGGPPLSPLSSAESISAAALGSARPLTSAPPRTAAHPERAATDVPLTLPSPQLLQSWGSASRGHTRRQFSQPATSTPLFRDDAPQHAGGRGGRGGRGCRGCRDRRDYRGDRGSRGCRGDRDSRGRGRRGHSLTPPAAGAISQAISQAIPQGCRAASSLSHRCCRSAP